MNIVIQNNAQALIELPPVDAVANDDGSVTDGYIAYRLLPGENNVPSAYWDKIKSNKAVRIYLASDVPKGNGARYLVNKGEGEAKQTLDGLDNISEDSAVKHISKCESTHMLSQWAEGTEKRGLLKAIDERKLELVASQTGSAD